MSKSYLGWKWVDEVKVEQNRERVSSTAREEKNKKQNLVLSQSQPYSFIKNFLRDFLKKIAINEKIFKEEKRNESL